MENSGSANNLIVSNDLSATGSGGAYVSKRSTAPAPRRAIDTPTEIEIAKAVYGHIRAIRALGRTTVNTNDIASALSLPVSKVNRALGALQPKGVKVR